MRARLKKEQAMAAAAAAQAGPASGAEMLGPGEVEISMPAEIDDRGGGRSGGEKRRGRARDADTGGQGGKGDSDGKGGRGGRGRQKRGGEGPGQELARAEKMIQWV